MYKQWKQGNCLVVWSLACCGLLENERHGKKKENTKEKEEENSGFSTI